MNCKPGDLAVIVRSMAGNEGKIVRCVRLASPEEVNYYPIFGGPRWVIDRAVPLASGRLSDVVADIALRPLRDNPGTDETLIYAGKPRQTVKPMPMVGEGYEVLTRSELGASGQRVEG